MIKERVLATIVHTVLCIYAQFTHICLVQAHLHEANLARNFTEHTLCT